MNRNMAKASVVQSQPILTKKVLKRLRFCAKYDGASSGGCDWESAE